MAPAADFEGTVAVRVSLDGYVWSRNSFSFTYYPAPQFVSLSLSSAPTSVPQTAFIRAKNLQYVSSVFCQIGTTTVAAIQDVSDIFILKNIIMDNLFYSLIWIGI